MQPFQAVLPRLVAAGHGLAVIVFCLGFDVEWVMEQVASLGLVTPHDRPIRRSSSKTPWTAAEIQQLIVLWDTNLYATCIGQKIGRSAGSVRYKAKWLGLAARDRSKLFGDVAAVAVPAPRDSRAWTIGEGQDLGDRHLRGLREKVTAVHLGRTEGAIRSRADHIGLVGRHGQKLTSVWDPNGPLLPKFKDQGWVYQPCLKDPDKWRWRPTLKDGKVDRNYMRVSSAVSKSRSYRDLQGSQYS